MDFNPAEARLSRVKESYRSSQAPTRRDTQQPQDRYLESLSRPSSVNGEFEDELEALEDEHAVLGKIHESHVNKFKILRIFNSLAQLSDSFPQVAINLDDKHRLKDIARILIMMCQSADYEVSEQFYVVVAGQLCDLFYEVGDSLVVFGKLESATSSILIRNLTARPAFFQDMKFLIISPDIKVKVTDLTSKSDCMRANVLRSIYSPPFDTGLAALSGTIQHSLFESIILEPNMLTPKALNDLVDKVLRQELDNIYAIQADYNKMREDVMSAVFRIIAWKKQYLQDMQELNLQKYNKKIRLLSVVTTEKAFSSNIFGLTGIVDTIFKAEITNVEGAVTTVDFPFELKTGKSIKDEYESQVLIYNYLMREESQTYDSGFGMIFYSNLDRPIDFVELDHMRFYNLMSHRNRIVSKSRKLKRSFESAEHYILPDRTVDINTCRWCNFKDACVTSLVLEKQFKSEEELRRTLSKHQSVEGLETKTSLKDVFSQQLSQAFAKKNTQELDLAAELDILEEEMQIKAAQKRPTLPLAFEFQDADHPKLFDGFENILKQLTIDKLEYFVNWLDLIFIEENFGLKDNPANKVDDLAQYSTLLDLESYEELKLYLKENRNDRDSLLKFSHYFKEEHEAALFLEKVNKGQSITLKHLKLNLQIYGTVKSKSTRKKRIFANEYYLFTVMIQSKQSQLQNVFQSAKNKLRSSQITVGWEYYDPVYRYENKMRSNLVRLATDANMSKLADTIVHAAPPTDSVQPLVTETQLLELVGTFSLTAEQKQTLMKCLNTSDYALILGMPGTGKTFLISLLLFCLVKLGKKVLVTSYTHSALDNMIRGFTVKFKQNADVILRLTHSKSTDEKDVNDMSLDHTKFENLPALEAFLNKKQLFFTTCLSLRSPILKKLKFDFVIVDESSQVLEPVLLESLFHAPRFVLIGDYFQLSPLVRSPEASQKRMCVSLLQRLCEANLQHVCKLTNQFRMNKDIMELSNELVYSGCLKAASEGIANQKLALKTDTAQFLNEPTWVREVLLLKPGVTLINVDNFEDWRKGNPDVLRHRDYHNKSKSLRKRALGPVQPADILNDSFLLEDSQDIVLSEKVEQDLAVTLVDSLLKYGVDAKNLTVITPYNIARAYLFSQLDRLDVDVMTIDRSQGLDKDCVIVVFPELDGSPSNDPDALLKSLPRLNVALTRAKKKLVLVGSVKKMNRTEPLQKLVTLLKSKNWVYDFDPVDLKNLVDN